MVHVFVNMTKVIRFNTVPQHAHWATPHRLLSCSNRKIFGLLLVIICLAPPRIDSHTTSQRRWSCCYSLCTDIDMHDLVTGRLVCYCTPMQMWCPSNKEPQQSRWNRTTQPWHTPYPLILCRFVGQFQTDPDHATIPPFTPSTSTIFIVTQPPFMVRYLQNNLTPYACHQSH